MSEKTTSKIEIPEPGGDWRHIGPGSFNRQGERIMWQWPLDDPLVLTPGSSINFWRNNNETAEAAEFRVNCKVAEESAGSKSAFKPDHPEPGGEWKFIGGGFHKSDRGMISWSWTGERTLKLTKGSQISVWKREGAIKEGGPEFRLTCKIPATGSTRLGERGAPQRESEVDRWMRSTPGKTGTEESQPYRAPENDTGGNPAGESPAKETAPAQVDPKSLAGNPANSNAETEWEAQSSTPPANPATSTHDDFDDDIPF